MPLSVSGSRPDHSCAARLIRLVLVVAAFGVLAVPMCAGGMSTHDTAPTSEPMSHAVPAVYVPMSVTPVETHCAGGDCAAGHQPAPGEGMVMTCLLLLVAVLVAALRSPGLRELWRSPPAAPGSTSRLGSEVRRSARIDLCVWRT